MMTPHHSNAACREWMKIGQPVGPRPLDDLVSQITVVAPEPVEIVHQDIDDIIFIAAGFACGMRRNKEIVRRPKRGGSG
jgi:hypothetical protein